VRLAMPGSTCQAESDTAMTISSASWDADRRRVR
jgi:hypothetical protein